MSDDSRHNYEYDVDLEGPSAPARVVRMVGHNKRVLEIGAGPGSITKHLVRRGNCTVTAVEVDEDAIVKLSEYATKIHHADLNDGSWPELLAEDGPFEVIVAGDVLEHLYDPWNTLKLMKCLVDAEGCIVISVPHVGHNAILACLMTDDFEYRDWGLLDRTHIRFFGLKNVQELFDDAGLKIVDAEFVTLSPEETEFSEKWHRLSDEMREILSRRQYGQVYQIVVKAVPKEQNGEPLDLMSVPGNGLVTPDASVGLLRGVARKYLKPETRRWILGIVGKDLTNG